MNEFIVVRHNPNAYPTTEARIVQAKDIPAACWATGWLLNEIISCRVNLNVEPVKP